MVVNPITRPGADDLGADKQALFYKLWAGEVLTAFHRENKLMGLTRSKTISSGKSAAFPITGVASTAYHVAGESVYGTDDAQTSTYLSNIAGKEIEIFVDDPVVSGVFVPEIDRLMNYFDERSVYTAEVGSALAEQMDNNILSTLLAAAYKDPADVNPTGVTDMPVADKRATIATETGDLIANRIFTIAELFDEYNIPKMGRVCVLKPSAYHKLASVQDLVNKDFTSGPGDTTKREIMSVAGFSIVMSNSFASTDETSGGTVTTQTGVRNDPWGSEGAGYLMDWRKQLGVCFVPDAMATVRLKEIGVDAEHSVERRGDLVLSDYIAGHGTLRPDCAAQIVLA
jgi:hypothetical protein